MVDSIWPVLQTMLYTQKTVHYDGGKSACLRHLDRTTSCDYAEEIFQEQPAQAAQSWIHMQQRELDQFAG